MAVRALGLRVNVTSAANAAEPFSLQLKHLNQLIEGVGRLGQPGGELPHSFAAKALLSSVEAATSSAVAAVSSEMAAMFSMASAI